MFRLFIVLMLASCTLKPEQNHDLSVIVDDKYVTLIDNALNKAKGNREQLLKALATCPKEHKEAVTLLISFMPERDLRDFTGDFILENTRLAFAAREKFAWAREVPLVVFYNDVLPSTFVNERRDNWRQDFFEKFAPMVENCRTIEEATIVINQNIKEKLGVIYSTKRLKADQSSYESLDSKLASCTGLSILLGCALRSVGIPCRLVGVAQWTDKQGNHTWNEVWINGQWQCTEYYFDGLDKGWFVQDAAAANINDWQKRVYATSYFPQQYWFPCVWDLNIRFVSAVDVSQSYKRRFAIQQVHKLNQGKLVSFVVLNKDKERVAVKLVIKNKQGSIVGEGFSKGAQDDLNNKFALTLPQGEYTVEWVEMGKTVHKIFHIDESSSNTILIELDQP